ncbi:anthrone oxygenase family protein [Geodermatophilus sp. SYSU D00708]
MLLIEFVLVPFWRATSPAEFREWFTAHSGRIRALMVPLGAGAVLSGAASAAAQVTARHRSAPAAVVAAGAVAGVVAITAAVNEPANHRFVAGELTGPETTQLLGRWTRWHHVRVVLGLVATGAASLALTQCRPPRAQP